MQIQDLSPIAWNSLTYTRIPGKNLSLNMTAITPIYYCSPEGTSVGTGGECSIERYRVEMDEINQEGKIE